MHDLEATLHRGLDGQIWEVGHILLYPGLDASTHFRATDVAGVDQDGGDAVLLQGGTPLARQPMTPTKSALYTTCTRLQGWSD